MKRTVVALTVTAVAVAGAGLASAGPDSSNGAQKSGLLTTSGVAPVACTSVDAAEAGRQTANGFVVLNAPGKPAKGNGKGATRKLVGEVALKGATPGAYDVLLASSGCGSSVGTLVVDQQGNGNLAFQDISKGAGTWYVVLTQPAVVDAVPVDVVRFASARLTVR